MNTEPTIGDVLKEIRAQESRTEVRIHEVLEAVNTFSEHNDKRFDCLETRMTGVENRLTGVENRLTGVENRLEGVERKLDRTDGKVNVLINVLERKAVITTEDKGAVLA